MAGVTDNCKECGFVIFDEQTRTMLCDECSNLPPSQRLSAINKGKTPEQVAVDDFFDMLGRERNARVRRDLVRQESNKNKLISNLLEEVKLLRRKLEASEIEEENVSEVKSFLRKFDNLDIESEF